MSSFKEKERAKEQQEKFQAILSALLKDEDNKYCVDCDAKGPRWASWNLGIFLCIRCAGIHRNLGVHISKVKSVNLDTWTAEQISMMQEMGNSRARAVYEANIPDGFRRPQTDSALEAFIRSKYEQKKYIAQEWVAPQPKVPKEFLDDTKTEKKKKVNKPSASPLPLNAPKVTSNIQPVEAAKPSHPEPQPVIISASNDLIGLDLGITHQVAAPPVQSSGGNELLDLFGGGQETVTNGSLDGNLFEQGAEEKKTSTKDSIMALFGGSNQTQVYGVPASFNDVYKEQTQQGKNVGMNPLDSLHMYGQYAQSIHGTDRLASHFGGVYMQQNQPVYPGMMGQPMGQQMGQPMGQQMVPPGMVGPTPGMLGQGMGMMGPVGGVRPQAMVGQMNPMPGMMAPRNPALNMPVYGTPNVYNSQQLQQLQYQQMQQQMSSLQLGGAATQPVNPTGWGQPNAGQTLSTNLWQ
ncbi:stromal membrane-associated protein 1-like isoform X2 [Physella acuta]|uniref:stromal membrane-associated protein 1-like isoform X2 n=1 Tax=Physella acuta TaxID=109671 RepID=UPI0027DCB4FB|nr:stromal membrane-associated protein 1-like isoform X2 [Physella acuta]